MPFCCINQHVNPTDKIWCNDCESLIAGAHVDDYSISSYIGKGNMSAVYLANQLSLNNRKVIIKVLPPVGTQANVDDFRREAAMLATLTHPYILPIYSYGVVNERHSGAVTYSPYLVLPYAEQGSLADIFVREGNHPWPLSRVVPIMEEAAEALDYAHSQGVLHRDVKPANMLQMGSHVMLSDFGVVSLIDITESHLTAAGAGLPAYAAWAGSPAYMAPEVWEYRPGRYSDQYALAVSCYLLLTAEFPWQPATSGSLHAWARVHYYTEPRPLLALRPDLLISVSKVLQRALAKEPYARYATVKEFAAELKAALRDDKSHISSEAIKSPLLTQARPPSAPEPVRLAPVQKQVQVATFPDVPVSNRFGDASRTLGSFLQSSDHDRWTWGALLLNIVLYILLAGQVFLMFPGDVVGHVGFFLLAACPVLLIGPLVAQLFRRRVSLSTYSARLLFGLLFGILNTLFSALVCYGVATLLLTFQHWGHDWLAPGDGLHIFQNEAVNLLPQALPLILTFLALSLLGGAIIELPVVRGKRSNVAGQVADVATEDINALAVLKAFTREVLAVPTRNRFRDATQHLGSFIARNRWMRGIQWSLKSSFNPRLLSLFTGVRKERKAQLSLFAIARAELEEDDSALVDKTYVVQAGISQSIPESFEGGAFQVTKPEPGKKLPFDILLCASENIELTSAWHQTLLYDPGQLESQFVAFTFRIRDAGHSSLIIDFYHQRRWIRTARLQFEAVQPSKNTTVLSEV